MSEQSHVTADSDWGVAESAVMSVALLGFAVTWVLYITSPPDGLVPLYGMGVSFIAGAYLAFLTFTYLK